MLHLAVVLASLAFQGSVSRCGTKARGSPLELFPSSDCSLSSTTIRPEYEPLGHALFSIPVVVHVLQSTSGAGQLSDATIQSQIDVLNEDFRAVPGTRGQNGADARIEFFLAALDPAGRPTSGITRTTNDEWFHDSGSYPSALAWDPARYLNLYTNQASGSLGYVPDLPQGGIVGLSEDRVVIRWSAFGRNAPIGPPFDLGRTATHEVGHFLGLYHTFDFGCDGGGCYTGGDRICDTSAEAQPVYGCPGVSFSCGGPAPFHNYMDYSDDDCYEAFTPEQINRMRCTLARWRPALALASRCTSAAFVQARTAGRNLNALSGTPPHLGSAFTLSLAAPGWTSAVIFGYARPATLNFANGMVGLLDPSSSPFFRRALAPQVSVSLTMPNDAALCGRPAHVQAVLLGGGGWALTNALELTAGS